MNPFPFSEDEWSRVNDAAAHIVNHSLLDDAVLYESGVEEMRAVLDDLRKQHGEHPVLLETEADFVVDGAERRILYQQAIDLATKFGLPTYSARISFAHLLLVELHEPDAAIRELVACQSELPEFADDWDRQQWTDLSAKCSKYSAARTTNEGR
jgi:hypothetical protein